MGVKSLAACHLRLPPHPNLPPRRREGVGCITRESCPNVLWPDLDRMYIDKLDGSISRDYFDRMSETFRKEQRDTLQKIEQHQSAHET